MHRKRFLLAIVAAVACSQSPQSATPAEPVFAAGGGQQVPTPQARYSWSDLVNVGTVAQPLWVPAGIRGDGRMRDGTPATGALSNEYQGSFCGVWANIITSLRGGNGNLNHDPDTYWSSTLPASCQPARSYRYYLNGPEAAPGIVYPHHIVHGISSMSIGEARIQPLGAGGYNELGVRLTFDDAYPPASSVLVTRLANVLDEFGISVRQWRIESRNTHRAMGFVPSTSKKGGGAFVPNGITYYMPFSLTVAEVPFPFPTYP